MSKQKTFDDAIQAIHRTLEEAEYQLSQLGEQLQFLVSPEGDVEIVRRGKSGQTVRPKIVIAQLKGCDPLLWRTDPPAWLRAIDPERDLEQKAEDSADADTAADPSADESRESRRQAETGPPNEPTTKQI